MKEDDPFQDGAALLQQPLPVWWSVKGGKLSNLPLAAPGAASRLTETRAAECTLSCALRMAWESPEIQGLTQCRPGMGCSLCLGIRAACQLYTAVMMALALRRQKPSSHACTSIKTYIHSQLLVLWCSGYAHGTSESLLSATKRELQCQHTPRPENLILYGSFKYGARVSATAWMLHLCSCSFQDAKSCHHRLWHPLSCAANLEVLQGPLRLCAPVPAGNRHSSLQSWLLGTV